MTPYCRSVLKYVITVPVALGGITKVVSLYKELTIPPELFWLGVALLAVATLVGSYIQAEGALREQAGFYGRVRKVKAKADRTFESLGVKTYLPLYCERPEDNAVREQMKKKGGVLVTGVPKGGKTRTALEAIAATWPNAFLLSVDRENLTLKQVSKFVVPSLFIFNKPAVVVFLDKLDALLDAGNWPAIDKLFNRLADQTSAVYVVATCDEGRVEERLKTLRESPRGHLFDPVRLGAISKEIADRIYVAVWNGDAQPLLVDITQPGYIVAGSSPRSGQIKNLDEDGRKVIRALELANVCGTADCPETLFWGIVEEIFGLKTDHNALLKRFVAAHLLTVTGIEPHHKIAAQHQIYLDEAYDTAHAFSEDLARLGDWLAAKGDGRRLGALAAYYWMDLRDVSAARRTYDRLSALNDPVPDNLARASAFYAAVGEQQQREETLTRALALVPKERDRARLLIGLGDVYLYRLRAAPDAMTCYNKAYLCLDKTGESDLVDLICRRSGDTLLIARRYSDAQPYFQGWQAKAQGDDRLDASERLAVAEIGDGDRARAHTTLSAAWKDLASGVRITRALKFLDAAEGCLANGSLAAAGDIAASFFTRVGAITKPQTIEAVDFAYHALSAGFVRVSKKVHEFLCGLAPSVLDAGDQVRVHINLGLSYYLLGDVAAAQKTYEKALTLASADPKTKVLGSGAESGLGDVELRNGDLAGAKERYCRALAMIGSARRDNLANWAHMGLADVALAARDFDEADTQFATIVATIDSHQQRMRIWLGLARVRMHAKQWTDAESCLKRGLSLSLRSDFEAVTAEFRKLLSEVEKQKPIVPPGEREHPAGSRQKRQQDARTHEG